ncbi:hepatitis A virus cellular receptor 1 homolog [Pelobates cultripes]|uniref:Hepatitis A virus cellular receptor 1 homolog n=1 Tax=Pelobates cultripes TaxID=61616 RepID=A0AAD1RSJ5_PELCU|nr:hepatitis A virus cellular receptor 1 homolog [Pelobates cultripes]
MAMKSLLYCFSLLLYTALSEPVKHVTGSVGDSVILPCKYSVTRGTTTMCWGGGSCPPSKCDNEIIWTDGQKVTRSKSERYRLLGDIAQGEVSMTISGVTLSDAGTYCCRVETPGWFNDVKEEITVEIQKAGQVNTSSTPMTATFQCEEPEYDYDVTDRIPERNQIYNNQFLKMSQVNGSPQKAGTFNSICTVIVPLLMRLQ